MLIKTNQDIELIKEASRIWKLARAAILDKVCEGIKLIDLDEVARIVIESNGASCAFHNYLGFPKHICISVNETLIHGVPDDYCLKKGDLVTFDIGIKFKNHFCDAAFSVIIGEGSIEAQSINNVCYQSLMLAIASIKPNKTTNLDLAEVIENYVTSNGYEVIRNFTGHGCGNEIHEDPIIPNYRSFLFPKVMLVPNMVICIEPMIMTKSNKYFISKKDNWAVIAKNKKLTCHWEHMILITENGCEILTE